MAAVIHVDTKTSVLAANFITGIGNCKGETVPKLKINCFTSTDGDDSDKDLKKKILVADTDKMTYVSNRSSEGCQQSQKLCKYYVGVYNRETGKMRICDTEMFEMHPYTGGDTTSELHDHAQKTFKEKTEALTRAFGAAKKRRAIEMKQRNAVQAEAIHNAVGEATQHALAEGIVGDLSVVDSPTTTTSSLTPPCNINAATPGEVYSLGDIITSEEMNVLQSPAAVFFNVTKEEIELWRKQKLYPHFILNHLSLLPLREDARWHQAKCLMYLNYMLQLCNANFRRKKPLPDDWPSVIHRGLLNRFTLVAESDGKSKGVRCMPARMKDCLIAYILVLSLILEGFHLKLTDLLQDLQIGIRKLTTVVRALGCSVSRQKSSLVQDEEAYVAVLKTPVRLPQARTPRERRSR